MTTSVFYGDAWELAPTLEPGSIDCIVTSPPYFGLRDYGTATWKGGDPDCAHKNGMLASMKSRLNGGRFYGEHLKVHTGGMPYRSVCGRCGAVRIDRQFGLESTPQEYVARLVDLFARLRPALKDCGTIWLNLGDSYAGSWGAQSRGGSSSPRQGLSAVQIAAAPRLEANTGSLTRTPGLKPKDLVGIPWRVAFALQADGWYLRSDIIWAKPNPMPESVTDRPTKSHEYVFLLAKSRRYYFDQQAVREEACQASLARIAQAGFAAQTGGPKDYGRGTNPNRSMRKTLENFAANPGRNIRTVWTITPKPFKGAHFATYPPELAERCIKAGTSERGVCPECGKPWKRVVRRTPMVIDRSERTHSLGRTRTSGTMLKPGSSETLGWEPTCSCGADPIPATVLDPFAGSGTTLYVADRLGRSSIGFELNEAYRSLIEARLRQAVS